MKRRNWLTVLGMALYCGAIFSAFLAWGIHSAASEIPKPEAPNVTAESLISHAELIKAEPLVYIETLSKAVAEYIDETVEIPSVNVIEDCMITYYCVEKYAHICGTGDGITATGTVATPGRTCAVDPEIIPYGSIVMVDYGDGTLHEYIAQDTGVSGQHVDICVDTHSEALELGIETADVYWLAPEVDV